MKISTKLKIYKVIKAPLLFIYDNRLVIIGLLILGMFVYICKTI